MFFSVQKICASSYFTKHYINLFRKNPLPGSVIQEEAALSRGVHTLVKKKETLFTIISPNNAGFYKMEIYAAKSPKIKGIKMIIPIGNHVTKSFHQ